MKIANIGVIGTGNHASENLLPALYGLEGAHVTALFARNQDKAEAAAKKFMIPRVEILDDVTAALADTECDAFIVSATPELHETFLRASISQGRHVFVEKPPVYKLDQMQEIVAQHTNAKSPSIVQFGFNFRHADFYRQLQAVYPTDEIRYARIRSFAAKPQASMWRCDGVLESSLLAVHIHAIEMLCYTLGTVKRVIPTFTWLSESKYMGTIVVEFDNSKTGVLELSNASNRFEYEFECAADSGTIYRCNDFNQMTVTSRDAVDPQLLTGKSQATYTVPFLRGGYERTGYAEQFKHFIESIGNATPDTRSINSCLETYKIIEETCNGQR